MFFFCCLFLLAADVSCPPETRCLTERAVNTSHTLQLENQSIDYTATAGNLVLKNSAGKGDVSLFYVAYTKKGVADPANRPVTFCFNGGLVLPLYFSILVPLALKDSTVMILVWRVIPTIS